MFLKNIHIKNYNQFENLELDLTYPKGHAKAGEPLEKICIIGDNGTGKTTILELIKEVYANQISRGDFRRSIFEEEKVVDYTSSFKANFIGDNNASYKKFKENDFLLLFFPVNFNLLYSILGEKSSDLLNGENEIFKFKRISHKNKVITSEISNKIREIVYDLSDIKILQLWERLRKNIEKSINKELEYRRNLLEGMIEQTETEIDETYKKLKVYLKENPNGLDGYAAFLNPIIAKFHLKLNIETNLKKFDSTKFPTLSTKDDKVIPREKWSTGIRQLIDTTLPLYLIKPKVGIALIDESENSLYPHAQRNILDYYMPICPGMQFIFATHSPILASSFDPWEVIELKFNEKGKVERKPYYKGENHVDNYHIHPKYLRWDSLFMDLFGLDEESNEARTDALMELAILKRDLKKSKGADKEKLQKEYEKLAEQLDWASL